MKRIVVLGSTGSIGEQTLDVVRKHPDRFAVVALAAGTNAQRLAEQADEFAPARAVLAEPTGELPGNLESGWERVLELAAVPDADVVVNAIVGARGLEPTLAALEAGKVLALANKESLVAGGELVTRALGSSRARLIPIDSEHSGLFQCLAGLDARAVRRLILTASGGPFRGRTRAQMREVTVAEALAHPTWNMGRKNSVDSATLMNKGLEAIEAHHLFGVPIDQVEIVVHPQSIVHGIVELADGSCIAQAANTDMRLPIQVALAWPERLAAGAEPIDWPALRALEFEPLDHEAFPAVGVAYAAARAGGTAPAVLNAANEEAVQAFLEERLPFLGIAEVVAGALEEHEPSPVGSLEDVREAERWAREHARTRIEEPA